MILADLWRYPPCIILLIMVDLVSGSYPPVVLIPRSMVDVFAVRIHRFYTNSHKSLILIYGSFLNLLTL